MGPVFPLATWIVLFVPMPLIMALALLGLLLARRLGGNVHGLTVAVWAQARPGLWDIYEILPGFIAGAIAIAAVSLLDKKPAAEIRSEFARTS